MRIPFLVITALSCIGFGCGGITNVDDLFEPTPTGGTTGKGGTGGQTGGSGGVSTGGTGGSGGSTTGGTGGVGGTGGSSTGGTGGVAGTGGVGGTGGAAGTGGTGGTGGSAGTAVDSGVTDARRDVVTDARDAGKGSIRCGTTTCDPSVSFCCLTSSNIRCLALAATTCTASSDRLHCDDTADCATGQICCATEGSSGNGADGVCILTTAGCGSPKQMLCDPTVALPCLGLATLVCSANGSGIISDYAYCHGP